MSNDTISGIPDAGQVPEHEFEPEKKDDSPPVSDDDSATVAQEANAQIDSYETALMQECMRIMGAQSFEHVLTEPIFVDKREINRIVFRRPKANDRYKAIGLCRANFSGEEVLMEASLLCAQYKHPNGRLLNVPREDYLSMAWFDSVAIERKFSVFINTLALKR